MIFLVVRSFKSYELLVRIAHFMYECCFHITELRMTICMYLILNFHCYSLFNVHVSFQRLSMKLHEKFDFSGLLKNEHTKNNKDCLQSLLI